MLKKGCLEFSTGFESTCFKIGLGTSIKCSDLDEGSCQILPHTYKDVLGTTHHYQFFKEDLAMVKQLGMKIIRYPIPWHLIESIKGSYDWAWMDQAMKEIQKLELTIIADPLHHTSFPAWISGFSDSNFEVSYIKFIKSFAKRYPSVHFYTLFNEPTPTILFCAHDKVWHPFGEGPTSYVQMVKNVARTMCLAAQTLKELNSNIKFVHVDTCEHHQALDEESIPFVRFLNERRFLILDLILGKVSSNHSLWWYLFQHGITVEDLAWFKHHALTIDYLGLDYYGHSEHQYHRTGSYIPSLSPRGFAEVAKDYWNHFGGIPLMLTETNIRGYISDRISWLKFMLEQTEQLLKDGIDIRLFCWFPFLDSTDWDRWVTVPQGNIDPVGLLWLDKRRLIRHTSELSELYAKLIRERVASEHVPAYFFQPPLDEQIKGFIKKFMGTWNWKQPHL